MPAIRLALRHVACCLAALAAFACAALEVDEDDAGGAAPDADRKPSPGVGGAGGPGGAMFDAGGGPGGSSDAGAVGPACAVHAAGECDGDVLLWCDGAGAEQSVDCSGMGLRCAFNDTLMRTACVPPAAVEEPPPGCNIPPEGDCDANGVLYLCQGDRLAVENCPATNRTCGWDEAAGRNACLAAPAVDMCGDVPREGRCVQGRAEVCRAGRVSTEDCPAAGSACEFIGGRAICVAPLPPNPCEGIPEGGMCVGDTAVYCLDSERTEVDCRFFGWICFSIPQIVTLCSDPNAGQPQPPPPDPPLEGEGEACVADGVAGVCRRVGQCGGTSTPGVCPGPAEVQCCT